MSPRTTTQETSNIGPPWRYYPPLSPPQEERTAQPTSHGNQPSGPGGTADSPRIGAVRVLLFPRQSAVRVVISEPVNWGADTHPFLSKGGDTTVAAFLPLARLQCAGVARAALPDDMSGKKMAMGRVKREIAEVHKDKRVCDMPWRCPATLALCCWGGCGGAEPGGHADTPISSHPPCCLQIKESNIKLEVPNKDDLSHLRGEIEGAPETPYAGGRFTLTVSVFFAASLPQGEVWRLGWAMGKRWAALSGQHGDLSVPSTPKPPLCRSRSRTRILLVRRSSSSRRESGIQTSAPRRG